MSATAGPAQPGKGDGLALGHLNENGNATANGAAPGRAEAMNRVAATAQAANRNAPEGIGAVPRQLPTCR